MSVGLGLLHRVCTDQLSLNVLSEAGIDRSLLRGDEVTVLDYVIDHMRQFGQLPAIRTIEAEADVDFPGFPDEPVGYWIDRVERRHQLQLISGTLARMQEDVGGGDLSEARRRIRELNLDLEQRHPTTAMQQMDSVASVVWDTHDELQKRGRLAGIPFGIEYLDRVSDGAQATDTIALVGRPGRGKSYFMFSWANFAHQMGKVPLVVTMEMSNYQCGRRIVAMRSKIPATLIRLGKVGFYARRKALADMRQYFGDDMPPFYLLQGSFNMTVEDLAVRVQEVRPDVVYVDGAYLLRTRASHDQRWERVTATAETLKTLALEFGLPVIASYQFNRRGAGDLGNIAFSDAVGQLASIVIGIDDEHAVEGVSYSPQQFKVLELLKGREGERGSIRVIYDMARMQIRQDSVISGYMDGLDEE